MIQKMTKLKVNHTDLDLVWMFYQMYRLLTEEKIIIGLNQLQGMLAKDLIVLGETLVHTEPIHEDQNPTEPTGRDCPPGFTQQLHEHPETDSSMLVASGEKRPIRSDRSMVGGSGQQPPIGSDRSLFTGTGQQPPIQSDRSLFSGLGQQPPIGTDAALLSGAGQHPPLGTDATLFGALGQQPPLGTDAALLSGGGQQPPIRTDASLFVGPRQEPHIGFDTSLFPGSGHHYHIEGDPSLFSRSAHQQPAITNSSLLHPTVTQQLPPGPNPIHSAQNWALPNPWSTTPDVSLSQQQHEIMQASFDQLRNMFYGQQQADNRGFQIAGRFCYCSPVANRKRKSTAHKETNNRELQTSWIGYIGLTACIQNPIYIYIIIYI